MIMEQFRIKRDLAQERAQKLAEQEALADPALVRVSRGLTGSPPVDVHDRHLHRAAQELLREMVGVRGTISVREDLSNGDLVCDVTPIAPLST